jgi:7-cyano-7-deazaguanine synthase
MKAVIPVSGGIDSSVIYRSILKSGEFDEIHTVTFDYGQRHRKEIDSARMQVISSTTHRVLDVTFLKNILASSITRDNIAVAKTKDVLGDPQTVNYVPNRNMILLSICTGFAESIEADIVFHGAALVDSQAGYWDGSIEFLDQINKINDLNRRHRVKVEAPLITKTKQQIIELGIESGLDFSRTWTCYEGKEEACGECPSCSSRIKGFIDAGYIDPIPYNRDIPWEEYNCVSI